MLNIKEKDEIFVTSDTHCGHDRDFVWRPRGFTSVKEHDEIIIYNINSLVGKDDTLVHLGDLCLNTTLDQFEELIAKINCQNIYMLHGNHPNPHFKNIYKPLVKKILGENYTPYHEVYPLRYKNIIFIGHYAEVILGGQMVILSHYPIFVWNHMSHGSWHLTGHSHNGCDLSKENGTHGKILDVGVDGHNCKPWTFSELEAVMSTKKISIVDHHK